MDTNIFFPEPAHMGGADPHAQEAKKVCSRCPVKSECLQYALDPNPMTERYGVWGGLGEKQRRKVRRQRALERAA